MNLAQLSARLDPSYNLKMQHLQAKIEGDYAIANYRGQQQARIEYDKQQNARQMERERRDYESDREQDRRNFEIGRENEKRDFEREQDRQRLQTSREIESDKHKHRLEMLDAELSQNMKKMEGSRHFDKLSRLDAMEQEVFSSASRNMDTRTQLRGEVFKQLAGALIQEKLAQKQHARDLEKMRLEHEQKKDARVWDQLCSYIFTLMENNEKKKAEEYIDKLVKDWETAAG